MRVRLLPPYREARDRRRDAMTTTMPKAAELSAEDRDRMRRLSEEVRGRLLEMALITGRALGIAITSDTIVKYDPTPHHAGDEASETTTTVEVVIIAVPDGNGGTTFGCYQDPPGICVPC
jgi:hypothetical protein